MKQILLALCLFSFTFYGFGQETAKAVRNIPAVSVQDINGHKVNTAELSNNGKPIIISFWATWCKPCISELTTINEVYSDWQKETGVKLIAVSIDDARSSPKVLPMVNAKAWDYEVLLDQNGDFKRALNVNAVPHTFLINGKGEIVWQHTSFIEGNELELIELVRKLEAGQPLD
jgi:cytochrome c biogenesis protein CcmG, thiol:disulfide interchange protein DsbE